MKLSFSTRGWEELSFDDMKKLAVDNKMAGIEVYNLQNFPALVDRGGPFHKYNTQKTARSLKEQKLSIPVFDSSIDISNRNEDMDTVKALIDIAQNMHVPYVGIIAMTED